MKKMIIPIAVLIFLAWGCKKDQLIEPTDSDPVVPEEVPEGQAEVLFEFNDIDNNVYHAIKIGDQIWSQENLKTTRYNDGTPISNVQDIAEWKIFTSGAYCQYMNDPTNSEKYGLLYNYNAVASNKLAPKGWHVASANDWEKLLTQLLEIANRKYTYKIGSLVNADDWEDPLYYPQGGIIKCSNCTGFTALPNGHRDRVFSYPPEPEYVFPEFESEPEIEFEFEGLGVQASWWTSDRVIIYLDCIWGIFHNDDKPINMGSGVRLVKDANFPEEVPEEVPEELAEVLFEFNDIDNNVYHAIQIGDQIWSRENLKTTRYNDGTPIPCIQGTTEWATSKSGAFCHYNNVASNSVKYGLLYNYYAIASKKLAPKGWHVASYTDWGLLLAEVGLNNENLDGNVGPLVDAKDWKGPFYATTRDFESRKITCTNSTGFTALPNGYRDIALSLNYDPEREFDCLGYQASWWTSDQIMIYLDGTFGVFPRNDIPSEVGSGVRLVKDAN